MRAQPKLKERSANHRNFLHALENAWDANEELFNNTLQNGTLVQMALTFMLRQGLDDLRSIDVTVEKDESASVSALLESRTALYGRVGSC